MKEIDSPDNVSLIKKQPEAQTREHDLLKNQIPNHEQFLKVSTKQCSFFILRQESGCSGYQIIATHSLKKLFLSVFFFSFCGLNCFLLRFSHCFCLKSEDFGQFFFAEWGDLNFPDINDTLLSTL